jgi:hypothetical protein
MRVSLFSGYERASITSLQCICVGYRVDFLGPPCPVFLPMHLIGLFTISLL